MRRDHREPRLITQGQDKVTALEGEVPLLDYGALGEPGCAVMVVGFLRTRLFPFIQVVGDESQSRRLKEMLNGWKLKGESFEFWHGDTYVVVERRLEQSEPMTATDGPFHETIVDELELASNWERLLVCLRLIIRTTIPENHEAIAKAIQAQLERQTKPGEQGGVLVKAAMDVLERQRKVAEILKHEKPFGGVD